MSARGTTNGNDRGSVHSRRIRRAWMMETYASDTPGFVRCYRCGCLLYNPDVQPDTMVEVWNRVPLQPLTIDRIIPGTKGGTYRRTNIRPACGPCNSSTGAKLAKRGKQ